MKSYYLVADTLQDIDQGLHEHLKNSGILRRMESVITWKELQGAYEDMIKAVAGARVKREDISNYVIKKAINYIREHYQEGITQEEVSRKLEITPEYLSTLFNREMGINFSLFLKQFLPCLPASSRQKADCRYCSYNTPCSFHRFSLLIHLPVFPR